MSREHILSSLREGEKTWDFVIIGGGATGLGCAIDAASRGYSVLLLEKYDFCKGTSSRSTKLVHGGVRYLQQGNISLVMEALTERGILRSNAPHLVHDMPFIVPNYSWWEGPFYGVGLKVYDLLARRGGFGRSRGLSKKETLERLPTLEEHGLDGGVKYYDGQFDDARLAVNMAQTAIKQGAVMLNYVGVTGLIKEDLEVDGVLATDSETGESFEIRAKAVINATGVWTDEIRRMDNSDVHPMIAVSQGIHIVLDKSFLQSDHAIMVPRTDDGRVLFAIPWKDVVVVGTTDTPIDDMPVEPLPFKEELDFVMRHAAQYLTKNPTAADVKSVFVGLRPLVGNPDSENTAAISRDHTLHIADSGLITITGGKWTTYRKMAEDTIDQAAILAGLEERPCVTKTLKIRGAHEHADRFGDLEDYGSDAVIIQSWIQKNPDLGERLHPDRPVVKAQVVWAVRRELARTVEDVLSRRTRELLLDARMSIKLAAPVAAILAEELGHDEAWQRAQVDEYTVLARNYMVPDGYVEPQDVD